MQFDGYVLYRAVLYNQVLLYTYNKTIECSIRIVTVLLKYVYQRIWGLKVGPKHLMSVYGKAARQV